MFEIYVCRDGHNILDILIISMDSNPAMYSFTYKGQQICLGQWIFSLEKATGLTHRMFVALFSASNNGRRGT
jgi:hypothetical protein